jgi:hypothetical protein
MKLNYSDIILYIAKMGMVTDVINVLILDDAATTT